MARKKKHEEHVNHERWLVSYADFITLLFAFFVVMYSVSSVNEGKFRVLSEAMVAAFRASAKSLEPIQVGSQAKTPFDAPLSIKKKPAVVNVKMSIPQKRSDSENPFDQPGKGESEGAQGETVGSAGEGSAEAMGQGMELLAQALEKVLSALIAENLVTVKRTDLWVEIEINSSLLFDQGEAVLDESAYPLLEKLAELIKPLPYPLQVEGHTDSIAVWNDQYASNWALSAARAADVVKRLQEGGVDPMRLEAIGLADTHPIAENETEEGRAKNRRVSIIIMSTADPRRNFEADSASLMDRDTTPAPSNPSIPEGDPADVGPLPSLDSRSSLSESKAVEEGNKPRFDSSSREGSSSIVAPLVDKPIRPIELPPILSRPPLGQPQKKPAEDIKKP